MREAIERSAANNALRQKQLDTRRAAVDSPSGGRALFNLLSMGKQRRLNRERNELEQQLAEQTRQDASSMSKFIESSGASPAQQAVFATLPRAKQEELFATSFNRQPKERRIIKDAQGINRFVDTEEQVFQGVKAPKIEQRKQDLAERKFDQEVKEFNLKLEGGNVDPEEIFKQTTKLRGEFTDLSKSFITQRDAFGRIQAAAKDPSAAGDIALIFNFMKVNDPGSTVREGEFATAQNAAGVPERVKARYNQIVSGERLTPPQRTDFIKTSRGLFDKANTQQQRRVKNYTGLSDRLGLDSKNVILDFGLAEQEVAAEGGGQPKPPAIQGGTDLSKLSNEQLLEMLK